MTVISLRGATDTETDSELLVRLLDVMRQPVAGGNAHDYKVWAQSVNGVSGVWVFPLRRGLGTVDVVITATSGLPSAETFAAVQVYIDSVRPVTAKGCQVLAPTVKTLDVTVAACFPATEMAQATMPAIRISKAGTASGFITPARERVFRAVLPT